MDLIDDSEIRDVIQLWADKNGYYELTQRISFVPEKILEELLFETPEKAYEILEEYGY